MLRHTSHTTNSVDADALRQCSNDLYTALEVQPVHDDSILARASIVNKNILTGLSGRIDCLPDYQAPTDICEKRIVTIAGGMICRDGILVFADTEWTVRSQSIKLQRPKHWQIKTD